MSHRRVLTLATLLCLLGLAGCRDAPPSNVRPPRPGVPAAPTEVAGIYRSIHQGLLQLRSDGELVLIVPGPPGTRAGRFTLQDGRMTLQTSRCGDDIGEYDVRVTGEQQAGKAVLNLAGVRDPCEERLHYLTTDPWVYADS
jgi:hypothetical protein